MKYVFWIHSSTSYYMAKAIIAKENLDCHNVVYLIDRNYANNINGKTNCSTFTKHFVPNLILLTQNKMCILIRWFRLFTSFVYLCISLA